MLSNLPHKEDPRITRTRNLIFHAYIELLSEKGLQALTVQDITERAGINRVTFYSHFADKYALLDFSIRELFHQEVEKRALNACEYSTDSLRALIMLVYEFVSKIHSNCSSVEPHFKSLVETQVKNQVQELLQIWLEPEDFLIDTNTVTTAASWSIYGLAVQWNYNKSKKKPAAEEFAEQVLPIISLILRETQATVLQFNIK